MKQKQNEKQQAEETPQEQMPFFDFKNVAVGETVRFVFTGAHWADESKTLMVWTDKGPISFYSGRFESYTNGFKSLQKSINTYAVEPVNTNISFVVHIRNMIDNGGFEAEYTKRESARSPVGYAHSWACVVAE